MQTEVPNQILNGSHRPIHGLTLYLGCLPLNLKYGKFTAYVFQDLLAKGYLFAISYGDINAEVQYTRIHSSCVTSETLRALNCDCKQQLNAALKKCVEKGNGIIFYLFQEGRGAGAIPKCRGLQLCQYLKEGITTFEGYRRMGLKPDYRKFDSVKDICEILKINPKWILLTNNPDKVDQFTKLNFNILRVENIEIKPSPYNIVYLRSKKEFGHHLLLTKEDVQDYEPPAYIKPFEPYVLDSCKRFIYTSVSYLPIKPVNKQVLVNEESHGLLRKLSMEVIDESKKLRKDYFVKLNYGNYQRLNSPMKERIQNIIKAPYWFKFHLYYDIASDIEYGVLEYTGDSKRVPLIRFFSEATLNRFPIHDAKYKNRYKRALEKIYEYGHGYLVFFFKDGQGSGMGAYVLRNEFGDKKNLGLEADTRDHTAFANLVKHHIGGEGKTCRLLEPAKSTQLPKIIEALQGVKVKIQQVIDLDSEGSLGHDILEQRLESIPSHEAFKFMPEITKTTDKWIDQQKLSNKKIHFTIVSVGQSKAHAFYLQHIINSYSNHTAQCEDFDSPFLNNPKKNLDASILIMISQGISPTCQIALSKAKNFDSLILFTAVTNTNCNKSKVAIIKKIEENNGLVINYPMEDEYTLLLRVVGPFFGFLACLYFAESFLETKISNKFPIADFQDRLDRMRDIKPSQEFIDCLAKDKTVCILASQPVQKFAETLSEKLMEALYLNKPNAYNYLDFPHGIFQSLESIRKTQDKRCCFILLHNGSPKDDVLVSAMNKMVGRDYPVWEIKSNLDVDFQILEYDVILNYFVMGLVRNWDIDQINFETAGCPAPLYTLEQLPF